MGSPAGASDAEVLVAGGGVAGVAAAVAAARAGCRVLLAERGKELGGIGVRGMLRTICGLYLNGATEPEETLNNGLAREFVSLLRSRDPHRKAIRTGKVFVLPYVDAELKQVLESLCRQEKDLTVSLQTAVNSVVAEAGQVTAVTADQQGGGLAIKPRVVIDCTGTGEAAVLAGAGYDLAPPGEIQMAGYTLRLGGLRGQDESLPVKVPFLLAQAVSSGALAPVMRFTTFSSSDEPGEGFLKFSADGTGGPEREERTRVEAARAVSVLAEQLPAFRDAVITVSSQSVLDREGRRIQGEYVLTEDDVLSARKFPDSAARNAWPVELWDRTRGTVYRYVPAGEYYEIPFRCLRVKGFSNLLVAGRCISVSHEALGSTRVMGACMAMGDAVGRAAAELVRNGNYPSF